MDEVTTEATRKSLPESPITGELILLMGAGDPGSGKREGDVGLLRLTSDRLEHILEHHAMLMTAREETSDLSALLLKSRDMVFIGRDDLRERTQAPEIRETLEYDSVHLQFVVPEAIELDGADTRGLLESDEVLVRGDAATWIQQEGPGERGTRSKPVSVVNLWAAMLWLGNGEQRKEALLELCDSEPWVVLNLLYEGLPGLVGQENSKPIPMKLPEDVLERLLESEDPEVRERARVQLVRP